MSLLKSLSKKQLKPFQFIFKLTENEMGFTPNSLKQMAKMPALLSNFSIFSGLLLSNGNSNIFATIRLFLSNAVWSLKYLKSKDKISLQLKNLVAFASSNASGCRYCQAHTLLTANKNGLTTEKLNAIWDYKTSNLFTEKEKAAIDFGFAAGSTPNLVEKIHIENLRSHFSEKQIVELGAIIALYGFLNRWNDSFATALEEKPLNYLQEKLTTNDWSRGKH